MAQPNRYTFESPASEGLIRTGKMLSSLLGDDEDSVSSLFEKTDEDEFFDEKTQTGNAYDSKRAGATDEQTLMYINLAKKGEKEKVALLSAGQNGAEDKKRVSGAKVKLEEVMAFLEFREDPKETKELINRDGKGFIVILKYVLLLNFMVFLN